MLYVLLIILGRLLLLLAFALSAAALASSETVNSTVSASLVTTSSAPTWNFPKGHNFAANLPAGWHFDGEF